MNCKMEENSRLYDVLSVLEDGYTTGSFEGLFPFLAQDCVMESQWVLTPNTGYEAVTAYFSGKGNTLAKSGNFPHCSIVELLGNCDLVKSASVSLNGGKPDVAALGLMYTPGKLCLEMRQTIDDKENAVIVDVTLNESGLVKRIDLCMPELFKYRGFYTFVDFYPVTDEWNEENDDYDNREHLIRISEPYYGYLYLFMNCAGEEFDKYGDLHIPMEKWIKTLAYIGRIAVVALKDKIANPEEDAFVCCEALLSYDVALEPERFGDAPFAKNKYAEAPFDIPYKLGTGFIPNYKNAVKVLANCVENHAFHRFPRACAESVCFHDGINRFIIDNEEVERNISAIIPSTPTECKIMHILTSDFDELLGWDALVIGNEAEPVAAFAISINKFGFVDEIWKLNPHASVFGYDEELHALAMLEYGMCSCKADILREYLAEKCIYRSEYADRMSVGAKRIIARLNDVASNLDDTDQYTCKIIPANEALRTQDDLPNIYKGKWCAVERQGDKLAAVIFIQLNGDAKITNILLSRDGNYLKLFESEGSSAAIRDIVPTNVKELLTGFYGKEETIKQMRDNETPDEDEAGAYVWKASDRFAREWLNNLGFSVTDTEIEDDCIGYACTRKQKDYAIYMYSYGKRPTVYLDAEYCQRLHSYPLSQDRRIIIVYLKVDTYVDEEGQKKYKVGSYGNTDNSPEMWILHNVESRNILLFYPRPEIFEMIPRLMAAYNTQNLDLLKAICTEDVGLEHFNGGRTLNDGFYSNLSSNYERYGKMKMAYVRYNDVLFSAVPYLEDYCYISFSVTNDTDRICNIVEKPLDNNFRELLITDLTPETDIGNEYPLISKVSFLPSDSISRFSVRMIFDNGEIRRYDFKPSKPQIVKDDGTQTEESPEYDEIGEIGRICFTDKIFAHGKLVGHIALPDWMGYRNYPQRGQGLSFVNGYSISTAEL